MYHSTMDFNTNNSTDYGGSLSSFARRVNENPTNQVNNRESAQEQSTSSSGVQALYNKYSSGANKDFRMPTSPNFTSTNINRGQFNQFPTFNMDSKKPETNKPLADTSSMPK